MTIIYAVLIEFMQNLSKEKSENGAKASGFHKQLLKFDFYILYKSDDYYI